MTAITERSTAIRYRLYFWLMNVSLPSAVALFVEMLIRNFAGIQLWGLPETIGWPIYLSIYPFASFVPLFLTIAAFMRDDYAEALWKRTVVILAYGVAIFPLAFMIFAWVAALTVREGTIAYELFDVFYSALRGGASGTTILTYVWHIYFLFFVAVFQFLRWRDAR
ncbi:hypothetical protein [Qipengyuania sp. ASV99]|uniref:hypothetical protein n=1 Tax=Qipengyuania sp. ASV99 TaxID=3399681 RepID=UPI003A4C79DF